jgi:hypothetical protein
LYRRLTAAALVLGPALFLADNLLHPKEVARHNEREQITAIADHYTRWQLAHALGFLAIIALAAAVLGLAFLVRRRQPLLGLLAGALTTAGLLGLAAAITIDGYSWAVVGEASSKPGVGEAAAASVLHEVQGSTWSLLYYLTPVAFIGGLLALCAGLVRQRATPVWAGGLLALAALVVGTETTIVSNAYFIFGAGILFAGGLAVANSVWRMTDDEFARGGS